MSRFIVKIRDLYLDWSTVADAPMTHGMQLDEFRRYYEAEYGPEAMADFEALIRRADETSASAEYNWRDNRAGPEEFCLNEDELYRVYCLGEELGEEWLKRKPQSIQSETTDATAGACLSKDASDDEVKLALERLPSNACLEQVESVLGAGQTAGRKRGPWLRYQWTFSTVRVTCDFDKQTGQLCGHECSPNWAAKKH